MTMPDFMEKSILPNHDGSDENLRTMFTDENRLIKRFGNANWRAFQLLNRSHPSQFNMDKIFACAAEWKSQLNGIDYPWLVWSVDDDWAYIQQKMVAKAGWTPVLGYDPRINKPKQVLKGTTVIDFNKGLDLPVLYMHFPLDFIHLFTERLAFFHSDLLVAPKKMQKLATLFKSLNDGEIAMTNQTKLRFTWMQKLFAKQSRLFELAGCITKAASQDIFDKGCSMWQGWAFHPNCPSEEEFLIRSGKYWDHGAGLLYWQQRYGGKVKIIQERFLDEGHFSRTSKDNFKVLSDNNENRNTGSDLRGNYDVYILAKKMGIDYT